MENQFEIILERRNRIEKAIEKLNSAAPRNEKELMNVKQVGN
jgi:hypothetical protein